MFVDTGAMLGLIEHDSGSDDDDAVNEDVLAMDMVMHNGYRYIPLLSSKDCRLKWPIPGSVSLSPHDRSKEVLLRNKCRTLVHRDQATGGYRSAMATHGIRHGTAYFEALLEEPNVRLGIAQLSAHLSGPVGMDRFGYGVTDSGHIVHDAIKTRFLDTPIEPNTIVGILVHIPQSTDNNNCELYSEQIAFEHQKRPFMQCKLNTIGKGVMRDAYIKVFVNGADVGVAFTDLAKAAAYFPMFSVYRGGRVTVNFGPHFVYPPAGPAGPSYQAWSDLYHD